MVEYVKLGEVINLISGRDLLSTQYNEDKIGIPYITGASNIEENAVVINRWTNEPAVISHKNDVLLTCKGTVGLVAMNDFGDCHLARQLMALRPNNESVDKRYLKYFIESQSKYLSSEAKSMIPGINREDVLSLPFPIRLISEQQLIVKVLDAVGALIAKRKQQIALLDDAVKSLFVEMFGDPVENPMGWDVVRLGDVVKLFGGFAFKSKDYVTDGVKLVQISNVHKDTLTWEEINYLPSDYCETYADYMLKSGDVVLAMTRPIIKSLSAVKIAVVRDSDLPCLLNQRVGKFVLNQTLIIERYIVEMCKFDFFKNEVDKFSKNSLQPNVSSSQIESISSILPPLALQKEFAARIEKIETQKRQLEVGLSKLEEAYGALMQEYFG